MPLLQPAQRPLDMVGFEHRTVPPDQHQAAGTRQRSLSRPAHALAQVVTDLCSETKPELGSKATKYRVLRIR